MKYLFDDMFKLAEAVEKVANNRLVACIAKRNNVISYGFNKKKTHPFMSKYCKHPDAIYLHAEVDAIINALRSVPVDELRKCDLYVIRVKQESRDGPRIAGSSKPCVGCMKAILAFGIKNVYYTENHGEGFECL